MVEDSLPQRLSAMNKLDDVQQLNNYDSHKEHVTDDTVNLMDSNQNVINLLFQEDCSFKQKDEVMFHFKNIAKCYSLKLRVDCL